MITTDKEYYDMFEARYMNWVEKGCPDGDPEILFILQRFYELGGLVPIFSCFGHPNQPRSNFYILFAYNENGQERLTSIYSKLLKTLLFNETLHGSNKARLPSPDKLTLELVSPASPFWIENIQTHLDGYYAALRLGINGSNSPNYKAQLVEALFVLLDQEAKKACPHCKTTIDNRLL